MDATASVIAIVDISFKIIQYTKEVRDGGKERSRLHNETISIYKTFSDLKDEVEPHDPEDDSTWPKPIKDLFEPGGVSDQLKSTLDEIAAKIVLPPSKAEAIGRKLKWPFDRLEVQNMIVRMRSCRETITLALGKANLRVSLDTSADVKYLRSAVDEAELESALKWISLLDFQELQKASQRRPLDGTGHWFLNSTQVRGWSECRTNVLWCYGIPGAGKTVLASATFQALRDRYAAEKNVAVLVAYCSFDDAKTHSASNILASFIKQLVQRRGRLSDAVRKLYSEHGLGYAQSRPPSKKIVETLIAELRTFDTTFIIIDGLDELRDKAQKIELLQTLEILEPLPKLMVTSRPVPAIETWFKETAKKDKYGVRDAGAYEQSLYYCDNCDNRHDVVDSSGLDTSDMPKNAGDPDSDGDFQMVEPADRKEDAGGAAEENEWRTDASYRCENCARDICVNCYERFDICFGCNNRKNCFKWAWPGTIVIAAHPEDLKYYIQWRIESSENLKVLLENARSKENNLQEKIVSRVQKEAHGMFLLAKFHMKALEEQTTARELINALDKLPANIDDIYDSVFARIGNSRVASTLERLLIIVATAQKPLSTEALAHAMTVKLGDTDIDTLQLPNTQNLAAMCAGLLEIDHEKSVRFSHETIGGYIANNDIKRFKNGHGILAEICLTYLQFCDFASGACVGDDGQNLIEERQRKYPLLAYAATYWGFHARQASKQVPLFLESDVVNKQAMSFLKAHNHVAATAQFMWLDDLETSSGWDAENGVHGLHLAAYFGLAEAVSSLLAIGADVDVEDSLRTTPLMYAAGGGHADIVHVLLHSDADPSRICSRNRTALHRACHKEHLDVVKDLVASPKDIAVNALDGVLLNISALMIAVRLENPKLVQLLLTRKDISVALESPSNLGFNALHMAVKNSNTEIVEILLTDGRVSIESMDEHQKTALTVAACVGYSNMVALLLKWGANANTRDDMHGPPLLRAVDENNLACVRLLIEHGVDYNFKDIYGRGILHGCALANRGAIMRYLLERLDDLDPNIQADKGETPLHDAVSINSEAVVRVLLDYKARSDLQNKHGKTPLRLARELDRGRLFDLLRAARLKEIEGDEHAAVSEAGEKDSFHCLQRRDTLAADYKMSIESAVRKLSSKAFKEYLDEMGDDADKVIKDDSRGLLHIAARYGQVENLQILLARGANIDCQDRWIFTPLHMAVRAGQYEAVVALLDAGCNVDFHSLLDWIEPFQPKLTFLLLRHGAKIEAVDRDRLLPLLSYAVDCNELDIVRILVERGGVPFQIKDRSQLTPYQRAKRAGNKEIAQYLYAQVRLNKRNKHVGVIAPVVPSTMAVMTTLSHGQEEQKGPDNVGLPVPEEATQTLVEESPANPPETPEETLQVQLKSDTRITMKVAAVTGHPSQGRLSEILHAYLSVSGREAALLLIIVMLLIIMMHK